MFVLYKWANEKAQNKNMHITECDCIYLLQASHTEQIL